MKIKNSILLNNKIVAFILHLFVRLIYLLNKKNFHHPSIDKNKTYVISFWHGDLLMQPFNYFKLKNGNVKAMISHHKDGEMITKLVNYLNIGCIRGEEFSDIKLERFRKDRDNYSRNYNELNTDNDVSRVIM